MPRPLGMVGRGILLAALATCALPGSAFAVLSPNITVDEDSEAGGDPNTGCSLREAVTAANTDGVYGGCSDANVDDEGISIPDGDYVLTRDGVDDTNLAGDLDILNESVGLNNFGGPVTIRGDLDMVGDDRVLDVLASAPGFAVLAVTIRDGRATGNGGGIQTAATTPSTSFITASTLTANQSPNHGGGLAIVGSGAVFINNSTFSGNLAGGDGGGIDHSGGGVASLKNDTVTNNAGSGKGGGIDSFITGTSTRLYNTIVAGNFDLTASPTFAPDCFEYTMGPELRSEQHNLIGDTTGCEGISAGMGDIRNANALLAPLALNRPANIRRTATHALLAASPARDAGDPGTCQATDQTDTARPIGPVCDIGAFEADPNPPATAPTIVPAAPTTTPPPARRKRCKKRKRHAAAAKRCKKRKK